jgi:AraC-like DNA-binding protein
MSETRHRTRSDPTPPGRQVLLLDCPVLQPLTRLAPPFEPRVLKWDELMKTARLAAPSTVVVVDPFARTGSPALDERVPALLAAAVMLPVVALVPFHEEFVSAARALLDRGVTEIADAELEATPEAIRLRLLSVHAQPFKKRVEASLSRLASADARTLVRAAAKVAADRGTAVELSRLFESRERTVAGWCTREGLPPPRRLLAWLRLLLALALLEEPHRSVLDAAAGAGYTDYSLRRALREMPGEGPSTRERTLREGLDAFNAELRELREKARRERRGGRAA